MLSDIEVDWWLVREDLFLNADNWAVHRVVNVWQVCLSWSLSDSTEFIINRSVTQANPSLVCSEIWYWNTSQVSANSWAHKNARVSCIWKSNNWLFIEKSGIWESISFPDLRDSKSSNKDELSIPSSLKNLTRWQLRDVELLVWVSDISSSCNHLVVDNSNDCLDSKNVWGKHESLKHIDLSSLDLIISILLVPESVLIEPVIGLSFSVKWIAEIWRSWWSNPISWSLSAKEIIDKFFILSLIVLLNNSEISGRGNWIEINSRSFTYRAWYCWQPCSWV